MALPTSINTIYVPGISEVEANDLNQLQQCTVQGAHGDRELLLSAAAAIANPESAAASYTSAGSNNAGWRSDSAAGYSAEMAIPLIAGDRIKSITCYLQEANASGEQVTARVWEGNPLAAVAPTQRGPTKTSGITGAKAQLVFQAPDADFPLTLANDRLYTLSVTLPVTSADNEAIFIGAKIIYDRPLV